jgi:hypothetical protein
VQPEALNLDENGNRVEEPRQYGYFIKIRTMGGRARINWATHDMPLAVKRAVRKQLVSALDALDRDIAELVGMGSDH